MRWVQKQKQKKKPEGHEKSSVNVLKNWGPWVPINYTIAWNESQVQLVRNEETEIIVRIMRVWIEMCERRAGLLQRFWLSGIGLVERPDEIRGIPNIFLGFPACGFRGIIEALPFDEVEETRPLAALVNFTVKDPLDLVFLIIIQFQRQRRVLNAVGDDARVGGLQQQYMKDWMYAPECKW